MDALQVATSLVIAKLHNLLSEQTPLSEGLKDQVRDVIHDLQSLNDQQQEPLSPTDKLDLLKSARDAENIIDRVLTKLSQPKRPSKGLTDTLSICCSLPLRTQRRGNGDIDLKLIKNVQNLSSWARAQAQRGPVYPDAGRVAVTLPSSACPPPQERNNNDESNIVGRESLVSNLETQLISGGSKLHVISVFGKEAIGKTALVRIVYSSAIVRNHFDCRAWIRVSKKIDPWHVMVELFKQVKSQELLKQATLRELIDVECMNEQELSDSLQRILMERRYLVVLDNLHDRDLMDILIMLLVDSQKGSRVIITTQDTSIPPQIDPWYSNHLGLPPLGREHSEDLLNKCCGAEIDIEVHPPTEAMNLAEKILGKCGGCPARILLLGGLLSVTEPSHLAVLLDRVADSPTLKDIMSLSYRELPKRLKPCALYLALFPKESEISTGRLFKLWLAEGLLFSSSETPDSIGLAKYCFGELVSRNLVHVVRRKWDGSARTCRLPGMLYDFYSQMAKESGYFQICDSFSQTFGNEMEFSAPRIAIYKYVKLIGQTSSPVVGQQQISSNKDELAPYSIGQLRSYVSFNTMKLRRYSRDVETLFLLLRSEKDPALLRVLDLEGVYKPALPEQIRKIVPNLRYLGLRWTVLESLPKSVCQLPNLETLDMKYTNITRVPSSIWEAQNLQHLYMNGVCFDDYINPDNMTLNCNIRTVSGLLIIGDESPMLKVLGQLTGLKKLALTCHPKVVEDAIRKISNLTLLESLRLRSSDQFGRTEALELSHWMGPKSLSNLYLVGALKGQGLSAIPLNLKVVTLSMSELKDDNPMAVLGMLKHLTALRLLARAYSGKALRCSEETFPGLRILKLWKLEELESLIIERNAMPSLRELEIKECKQLQEIDGLQHIKTLEEVVMVKVKDKLARSIKSNILIKKELVLQYDAEGERPNKDNNEDGNEEEKDGYYLNNFIEGEENGEDE